MAVIVTEELSEKVVEARNVSDREMIVVLVFEEDVLRWICGYALQGGRSFEERQFSYDVLKGEWNMRSVDDLVVCLGDFNEHVGKDIDGFYGVHER